MSTEAKTEPRATSALAETSVAETVVCNRCGWDGDASDVVGKGVCPECKGFMKRNVAALVHGGRRFIDGQGTPMDHARRVEIRDAVLTDLGGEEEVSEVLQQLVEDFSFACVLRDLLAAHLAAVGPLTAANRKRACVGLYFDASARAERLANRIGTGRRSANAGLLEYMKDRSRGVRDGRV